MIFKKAGWNILLSGIFIFFIFQTVFSQTVIFNEFNLISNYTQANTVYITDINGDGFKDILACAGGLNEISWWGNDGYQNFTKHTVTIDFLSVRYVYAEDINNDGEMDIIGAAWEGNEVAWWENDGNEIFTKHTVDSNFIGAHTCDAKDVNGDGFMDILCSGFDYYGHEGEIAWWQNNGQNPIIWTKHLISDRFQQSPFIFGDYINSDNHLDVLACGELNGEVLWWENNGDATFTEHMIDSNYSYAHTVFTRDLDQDGDKDVLGAACMSSQFTWWENLGSEVFYKHHIDNLPGALWIDAADINNDGFLDLIGAGQGMSSVNWYENDGLQNFTRQDVPGYCAGPFCVVASDIDEDNDYDLAAAGWNSNRINWWENIEIVVGSNNFIPAKEIQLFNYPNPFNPSTNISYQLTEKSVVEMSIYNIKGQEVKIIVNEVLPAGEHSIVWDGKDENNFPVGSGVYFYQIRINGNSKVLNKMILMK